jgi:hypothetical protein
MTLELGALMSMVILSIWAIYMSRVAFRTKKEEAEESLADS